MQTVRSEAITGTLPDSKLKSSCRQHTFLLNSKKPWHTSYRKSLQLHNVRDLDVNNSAATLKGGQEPGHARKGNPVEQAVASKRERGIGQCAAQKRS